MDITLKQAWSEIVEAHDYEQHMAAIGQAGANAKLVKASIKGLDLPIGSRILFPGAGPGQMFDFVDPSFLSSFKLTFTDINQDFLQKLAQRAMQHGLEGIETHFDDVEAPIVTGPFDLVVLVLVLEHVNWKKALSALADLPAQRFLIIYQQNPVDLATNVSPNRKLPPSLVRASQGEKPHLLDPTDLEAHLQDLGYSESNSQSVEVADGKHMCSIIFTRTRGLEPA